MSLRLNFEADASKLKKRIPDSLFLSCEAEKNYTV